MRKALLIALLMFIAVAGSGWCVAWMAQATATKNAVRDALVKINEKQQYITYDAIETSGFPTDVYVSIVKPHFSGRVDTLIKSLFPGAPAQAFANLPEWNGDWLLDGSIVFGVDAASNQYGLRISGDWKQTNKIKDQTFSVLSHQAGDITCVLELERKKDIFAALWNFQPLIGGQTFLNSFRMADCNYPGGTSTDQNTHETLATAGPMRVYASSTPQQGALQQVRVYMKIADIDMTPAGENLWRAYFAAFSPGSPPPVTIPGGVGKQNFELDFSYLGPSDLKGDIKNQPFDIALNKFALNNAVYDFNHTIHFTTSVNGDDRNAHLTYKMEGSFGEQYDTLMQAGLRSIIYQVSNNNNKDPRLANWQAMLQKHTPDEDYAILYPLLPNLHAQGKMVGAIDVGFQGKSDLSAGNLDLTNMELSSSLYGLTGVGKLNKTAASPVPTGNVTFTCRNCLRWIDDVTDFHARIQKTLSYLNPDQPASPPLNPKLVEGIKNFLSALNDPSKTPGDNTTFTYNIVSSETSGISVNGKSRDEIMALRAQYIVPAQQKPAP